MKNKAQNIRLGLFLLTGSVIVIFVIGYFTALEIFKITDTYFIRYKNISVNGLEVGSPVKFLGIRVGSISKLEINPKDITEVVVKVELDDGTPIKKDAVADIVLMGITGMKAIEIRGGSEKAPLLKENAYIKPGKSLSANMTGKAETIALKTEQLLNNLQLITDQKNLEKLVAAIDNINELIDAAKQTVNDVDTVIIENREMVNSTISIANDASINLYQTSEDLQSVVDKINRILAVDKIDTILTNTADITKTIKESNIKELIEEISVVAERTNLLLSKIDDDVNQGSRDFSESLRLLKLSLRNLNEATRKINSDPSILIRGTGQSDEYPDERLKDE